MAGRTTSKGHCLYTAFTKTILCAGTMTDLLEIVKREQQPRQAGEGQASEGFTSISDSLGYLEDANGTPRFDGVSIADGVTHAGYIPFDQDIFELDRGSLWVRYTGTNRTRLFKLIRVQDYHEQEEYILLQLTERGFDDLEAATA